MQDERETQERPAMLFIRLEIEGRKLTGKRKQNGPTMRGHLDGRPIGYHTHKKLCLHKTVFNKSAFV